MLFVSGSGTGIELGIGIEIGTDIELRTGIGRIICASGKLCAAGAIGRIPIELNCKVSFISVSICAVSIIKRS